jgi:hypothetical protein
VIVEAGGGSKIKRQQTKKPALGAGFPDLSFEAGLAGKI